MRTRLIIIAALLLCGVGHTKATEPVDPERLSTLIEQGTRAIWPDMKVDVTIDGCSYHKVKDFFVQDERTKSVVNVDLRDIETDPGTIFRNGQRMTDGSGRIWWSYNIIYYWNQDFLTRQAKEISALEGKHRQLDEEFYEATSVELTDAQFEAAIQESGAKQELLFKDQLSGRYGDVLARNYRTTTTWKKNQRAFYLDRFRDTNTPNASYLDFSLNDDVSEQILADLHAYVQSTCQPPQ